jgi:hypothetical protein
LVDGAGERIRYWNETSIYGENANAFIDAFTAYRNRRLRSGECRHKCQKGRG